MVKAIHVSELKNHSGEDATVQGFVHTLRVQSKIIFLILRDVTGIAQTVVEIKDPEVFEIAKNLSHESVVRISGLVKDVPQAPGGFEIGVSSIEVLSVANPELPIPIIEKGNEETEAPTRFDYRWIDLRKPEKTKIFKVWTELEKGFRKYWDENGYTQLYSPSFMSTPSETGAEVFEVNYFDRKAYLAQSPQFYKQMGIASGFERVFIAGPVFRAEESFTTRHMTEFTGWDFEIGFIDSHHDVMDQEEGMIVSGFENLKAKFPELDITVPSIPFPRIKMTEAKEILSKEGIASSEDHDLSPEEERAICEYVKKEHNHEFVFITDYHKSKSAFYHMRLEEGSDRSRRADLLFRGIEITTLAQREHRIDILEAQAKEKGMSLEALSDYLNFFRYGCPPHGGAGIGPGRLIMKILDLPNVREATYLPRDVKRLNP
ncbi:MAG: aspartate--tRNA(Asn) ligase [Candidatus Pacebacteria bacterium]|nr:aspartate--tRNA(Asn) ligase [Candidatus Paceibacterota bacterium]MBP9772510.1 aspartate--tRNA(Asn) ligase [Candidatus Paceibacterota bacterium]